MGRSVTCTFSVHTQVGTKEYITGAMSLKQAYSNLMSEYTYQVQNGKPLPECAYIWPQTAAGRKLCKGYDYIKITLDNKRSYHMVDEMSAAMIHL